MQNTVQKKAIKGETKGTVTGWFITRSETGEVLHPVNISCMKRCVEFAGFAWNGALVWKWLKAGEKVTPFFQKAGAMKLAKAFELLTGERVAVIKRLVA